MSAVATASQAWLAEHVHFEWFKPRASNDDEASESFEVVCAQSGVTVEVGPGISILDALADAGIDHPHSCERGVCGACECRVIEGAIEHRDNILSPAERAKGGVMLPCVSRAKDRRLVLDI